MNKGTAVLLSWLTTQQGPVFHMTVPEKVCMAEVVASRLKKWPLVKCHVKTLSEDWKDMGLGAREVCGQQQSMCGQATELEKRWQTLSSPDGSAGIHEGRSDWARMR